MQNIILFLKRLRNLNCVSFDMALTNKDCNLGQIDFEAVQNDVEQLSRRKREERIVSILPKNVSISLSMP